MRKARPIALRAAEDVCVVDAHDLVDAGCGCGIAEVEEAARPAQRQYGLLPDMGRCPGQPPGGRGRRSAAPRLQPAFNSAAEPPSRASAGVERTGDVPRIPLNAGDRLTKEAAVDGEGRRSHARNSRSAAACTGEGAEG